MSHSKNLLLLCFIAIFAFVSACENDHLPEDIGLPEILAIHPADGAANVSVNSVFSVTFKDEIDERFIVSQGSKDGCFGTVQVSIGDFDGCVEMRDVTTDDNKTFTVKPLFSLDFNRKYRMRIVTLTKDSEGDYIPRTRYETPEGFTTAYGGGPPAPGNSGNINVADLSADHAELNWTPAYDSSDATSDLKYKVVKSDKDNINAVSQAEANGETIVNWTKNVAASGRINFASYGEYYFNVLVKDSGENKAAYKRIVIQTPDGAPVPGDSGNIAFDDLSADSVTLAWGRAWDAREEASSLRYKLIQGDSSDAVNEVSEILNAGDDSVIMDLRADATSAVASGLDRDTTYHFNVLVQDSAGNSAIYNVLTLKTAKRPPHLSSSEIESISFHPDFIEAIFSEEMDTDSITVSGDCSSSLKIYTAEDECVSIMESAASSDNRTFILIPSSALTNGNEYKIKLASEVRDSSGKSLTDGEYSSESITALSRGERWESAANGAWTGRYDSNTAVFNNEIWLLGGYDGSSKLNEILRSEDGFNWEQTTDAAWSARQSHAVAVFDDKIWVFGGDDGSLKNDVWRYNQTDDAWTEAPSAPWSARSDHSAVVFDDKIWIAGGCDGSSTTNDVWYSEDGENWENATHNAGWPARRLHSSAAFDGKIWIMGGEAGDGSVLGDVWHSSNGVDWIMATDDPAWQKRRGQCSIAFDGAIWLTGGHNGSGYKTDVWLSKDGANWIKTSGNAWPSRSRSRHSCVDFQNKLWILGGKHSRGERSDVWHLDETWTQVASSAKRTDGSDAWDERSYHTVEAFDGELWVMGGYDGFSTKSDVWRSEDGVNWELSHAAPWGVGRYQHASLIFQNKLWVMGGGSDIDCEANCLNDVWSYDQINGWVDVTSDASWGPRRAMSGVVFDGRIWITGGYNGSHLKDVWHSTDGANWTLAAADAWGGAARSSHKSIVFDNKIWTLGGRGSGYLNDVWRSEDGATWTKVNDMPDVRAWFAASVFDDRIWIMGGNDDSTLKNDVYYSKDGANWIKYNANASWANNRDNLWPGRSGHDGAVWNNELWILGGEDDAYYKNDVWRTESLKTENAPPTPGGESGADITVVEIAGDSITLTQVHQNKKFYPIKTSD